MIECGHQEKDNISPSRNYCLRIPESLHMSQRTSYFLCHIALLFFQHQSSCNFPQLKIIRNRRFRIQEEIWNKDLKSASKSISAYPSLVTSFLTSVIIVLQFLFCVAFSNLPPTAVTISVAALDRSAIWIIVAIILTSSTIIVALRIVAPIYTFLISSCAPIAAFLIALIRT